MKKRFKSVIVVMLILSVGLAVSSICHAETLYAASDSVVMNASASKLNAPSISVKSVKNTFLKISWKKCKGAAKYEVYRAFKDGKYKRIVTTTKLHYEDIFLKNNTKYFYKVRAVSKTGKKSSFSKIKYKMITLTEGTYKEHFGVPDFGNYFDVPLIEHYTNADESVFVYHGGDLLRKGYQMEEVVSFYGNVLQDYGFLYTGHYYDPEEHASNYTFERNGKESEVIMGVTPDGMIIHVLPQAS